MYAFGKTMNEQEGGCLKINVTVQIVALRRGPRTCPASLTHEPQWCFKSKNRTPQNEYKYTILLILTNAYFCF